MSSPKFTELRDDEVDDEESPDGVRRAADAPDTDAATGALSSSASGASCWASSVCCGSRLGALAVAAIAIATVALVIALLVGSLSGHSPSPPERATRRVVHVSDLHLDNFYDSRLPVQHCHCHTRPAFADPAGLCTAARRTVGASGASGSYGCDAPEAMVRTAITMTVRAAAAAQSTSILVSGDLTRHWTIEADDPSAMVRSAFHDVTAFFQEALTNEGASKETPVIVAWGNDDFSKNYLFNTSVPCAGQTLMQQTAKMLEVNLPALHPDEASRMQCAGFYRYDMPVAANKDNGSGEIRVLVLNTVMYSVKLSRWFPNPPDDPMGQFTWLRQELQSCREDPTCRGVWVLGHIAPGREICAGNSMWLEQYVETYVAILRADALAAGGGACKAQFFGHEHVNSVRLISADKSDAGIPPIFIQAAVSTIYENRPSFRVVDFNLMDATLVDFTVWSSRAVDDDIRAEDTAKLEASWAESFSASEEFGLSDLSTPAVLAMIEKFSVDPTTGEESDALRRFLDRAWDRGEGTSMPPPGSPCVRVPDFCYLKYSLERDITKCLSQRRGDEEEIEEPDRAEEGAVKGGMGGGEDGAFLTFGR